MIDYKWEKILSWQNNDDITSEEETEDWEKVTEVVTDEVSKKNILDIIFNTFTLS